MAERDKRTWEMNQTTMSQNENAGSPGQRESLLALLSEQVNISAAFFWALPLWGTRIIRLSCASYAPSVHASFVFSAAAGFFAVVLAALFATRFRPSESTVRAGDCLVLLGSIASALLIIVPEGASVELTILSMALAGLGYIWFMMRWNALFCLMPGRAPITCILVSYGIFFIIYLGVRDFFPLLDGIAALGLPVLTVVGLRETARRALSANPPKQIFYSRQNGAQFWRILLAIGIFALALGFEGNLSFFERDAVAHFVCGVAGLIGVAVLFPALSAPRDGIDFRQIFEIALLLFASAVFLSAYVPVGPIASTISGLALASAYIISLLIRLAIVDVGQHSSFSPYTITGIAWAVYEIPRITATFLNEELAASGSAAFSDTLAMTVIYLIALSAGFLLSKAAPGFRPILSDWLPTRPSTDLEAIDTCSSLLAAQYGLTQREEEILRFICRGRSKAYIAETLVISENTVRTHSKALYAKLGVHSKQELIDKVYSIESAGQQPPTLKV